jgi:transposase-like protein
MRQVREIIRLKLSASIPTREIARRLGVAASTVRETLRRFEGAALGWPLPDGMSDGGLEAALYANHGTKRGASPAPRAGLADGSSGAEAQARHPGDRLG